MFLGGDFWLFLLFVVFIFFLIFLFEIFFFFDFEGKVKRLKICLKYFQNKFILFIINFKYVFDFLVLFLKLEEEEILNGDVGGKVNIINSKGDQKLSFKDINEDEELEFIEQISFKFKIDVNQFYEETVDNIFND